MAGISRIPTTPDTVRGFICFNSASFQHLREGSSNIPILQVDKPRPREQN